MLINSGHRPILFDDRLLIALLLGATLELPADGPPFVTSAWYYRACRAAVLGSKGQLSGAIAQHPEGKQAAAVLKLLDLPDGIGLPSPRSVVPVMGHLAERHPKLNWLNLEAASAALVLGARVALSPRAAEGVLPRVLDAESVPWAVVTPEP